MTVARPNWCAAAGQILRVVWIRSLGRAEEVVYCQDELEESTHVSILQTMFREVHWRFG